MFVSSGHYFTVIHNFKELKLKIVGRVSMQAKEEQNEKRRRKRKKTTRRRRSKRKKVFFH